ncbi:MAG TPA: flagellar export chaperone FlgN [Syntrophorhabdaceae bacterium]|nr:flagellar export chaperone FlgN [Syntrophorhabdaceae bacterium]HOT41957.1 flagellar export chaperone FlgN [Syntrophorhabdaceae bacterium]HPC67028.1 flagellar export chaperone FlgN [Syntrophorhabdaceae bacterium]HQE79889.1 flagellar export chaperone FlgN [Syntrophorhabdaceae bacterium]HQH42258.1 flagellar export chaperone FlgN [Syntrophorhabdaceae bacterium]
MEHILFDIAQKELNILKDFHRTLKEERDAIISFSIDGIIRGNNKKEELLKKIEFLEAEKEKLIRENPEPEKILNDSRWVTISREIKSIMNEINIALGKNINLLSFSVDYVKNSIDNIVDFVNKASYNNKKARLSVFPPREI